MKRAWNALSVLLKSPVRCFLFSYVLQLLAAGSAWLIMERPAAALPFMAADAAGKSLTAALAMQILGEIWQDGDTGAFLTAYTVLLYNQNSILKFQVTELFPGMIRDPMERLAGGLLVNLSILVSCRALQVFHRRIRRRRWKSHPWENDPGDVETARKRLGKDRPILPAALTGAFVFAILRTRSLVTTGRTLTVRSGRVLQTVWSALLDLLYLLCIAAFLEGRQRKEAIPPRQEEKTAEHENRKAEQENRKAAGQNNRKAGQDNRKAGQDNRKAGQWKRTAGEKGQRAGQKSFRWDTMKGILPLGIVFLVQLVTSLSTGSRQHISELVLYSILAMLVTGNLEAKDLEALLYLSPPVLILLSLVSEKTSGRLDPCGKLFSLQYHAFRCDLSDFAVTIASRNPGDPSPWYLQAEGTEGWETILLWIRNNLTSHLQSGIRILQEALYMSIPRILTGDSKPEQGLPMYAHSLQTIGLSPQNTDYNDTYFSMGAQILGLSGIFLIFFLVLLFQDLLSRILCVLAVHAAAGQKRSKRSAKRNREKHKKKETGKITRKDTVQDTEGNTEENAETDKAETGKEKCKEKYKERSRVRDTEKNREQDPPLSPEKVMLILGIPFYARAEGDWFMCFYQTRDFLLSCMIFLILFRFSSAVHHSRKNRNPEKTVDRLACSEDYSSIGMTPGEAFSVMEDGRILQEQADI